MYIMLGIHVAEKLGCMPSTVHGGHLTSANLENLMTVKFMVP